MVVVLVATRYQKILNWIREAHYQDIESIDIIKQKQGQIFLYVKTSLLLQDVMKMFHKTIYQQCSGIYVYEFYGIYNGKIDFHSYLSSKSKDKIKYYHTNIKDITQKEIDEYLQV